MTDTLENDDESGVVIVFWRPSVDDERVRKRKKTGIIRLGAQNTYTPPLTSMFARTYEIRVKAIQSHPRVDGGLEVRGR